MRIAVAPDRWLALLVVACASCSTGCAFGLIGTGIGALVPRWEEDVSTKRLDSYKEKGTVDVDVQLRPGVSAAGHVSGSYGGVMVMLADSGEWRPSRLVVVAHKDEQRIDLEDVQRIDVRRGSCWLTGMGVGIALDVIGVVVLAAVGGSRGFGIPH